jgi:UDP-N-acetylglucosamine 2-epimerase (non-hydrolysing)
MKVLTVFGTRPEAIKMAPVIRALAAAPRPVQSVVCVTGQHRQMLDQILGLFDIRPDHDLDIMLDGQDLFDISVRTLAGMRDVLARERPDAVLVQGDTTSAFLAALASFYQRIPVGHVEAGLRTGNPYDPFPEEMNRTLITQVATWHFAPTARARDAVLAAGASPERVHLTGNTVVDAIRAVVAMPAPPPPDGLARVCGGGRRLIVVTSHRRESFGAPMRNVFLAIRDVLARHPDVVVVFPVHLNPNVRAAVRDTLGEHPRLVLLEPLPYDQFAHLMQRAYLLLTDSGGVQEEASALGKPVVVVRDTTERAESVEAGVSVLVGRERAAVAAAVARLLDDADAYRAMARAECPYGDGRAAARIVGLLAEAHARGDGARSASAG